MKELLRGAPHGTKSNSCVGHMHGCLGLASSTAHRWRQQPALGLDLGPGV